MPLTRRHPALTGPTTTALRPLLSLSHVHGRGRDRNRLFVGADLARHPLRRPASSTAGPDPLGVAVAAEPGDCEASRLRRHRSDRCRRHRRRDLANAPRRRRGPLQPTPCATVPTGRATHGSGRRRSHNSVGQASGRRGRATSVPDGPSSRMVHRVTTGQGVASNHLRRTPSAQPWRLSDLWSCVSRAVRAHPFWCVAAQLSRSRGAVPVVYPRGRTCPERHRLVRPTHLGERLGWTPLDGSDEPTDQKLGVRVPPSALGSFRECAGQRVASPSDMQSRGLGEVGGK